jgi:hypothetical protein
MSAPVSPRAVQLWKVLFTALATLAVLWWWLMPGGFPADHPRYWANRVVPVVVFIVAVAARIGLRRPPSTWADMAIAGCPALWLAGTATAVGLFPYSAVRFALPAVLVGAGLLAAAWWTLRRQDRPANRGLFVVAILAAAVGVVLPFTQRAPEPDTHPLLGPAVIVPVDKEVRRAAAWHYDETTQVSPAGTLFTERGGLRLVVEPLLSFESRSPDRCWTSLALRRWRLSLPSQLVGYRRDQTSMALLRADHNDIGGQSLTVAVTPASGEVLVEAHTYLPEPVYSHLNGFCTLTVAGHSRPFVAFSPCPGDRVEVTTSDYPIGRPRRLAYLGSDGVFRVVEATSGEKGPFRELASGSLRRDEPLTMTLCDGDRAACEVVLSDWAAQAGTQLSPTAGWGLPVNAIEFSRERAAPGSEAYFWITLAGTSVGRGWDSVGHAAGTYRNRMTIREVPQ